MRRLSALVIAALAATTAGAQGVVAGARVGPTSATQRLTSSEYQRVHGFTAGATAAVELAPWLALHVEADYVQKGARYDALYLIRMDYLEAPLALRLSTPMAFSGIRPFVMAGVAPSVELRCYGYTTPVTTQRASWSSVFAPGPPTTVPLDCNGYRLRHTDRGDVVGGGFAWERGRTHLTLEVRRTRGEDISGYDCCQLLNDVTSVLVGVGRRLR